MNTKTTKFLAVLAVLAFAFAAFAVITPSESDDAASATASVPVANVITTDTLDLSSVGSTANYYLTVDCTVTVTTATGATSDLYIYLATGVTATFTGTLTAAGDVVIRGAESATSGTTNYTINYDDTLSASLNTATAGKYTYTYTESSECISYTGVAAVLATVDGGILYTDYSATAADNVYYVYADGSNAGTITMTASGDALELTNGTVIVAQDLTGTTYDSQITFSSVVTGTKYTVAAGNSAIATLGGGVSTATGTITMNSGEMTCSTFIFGTTTLNLVATAALTYNSGFSGTVAAGSTTEYTTDYTEAYGNADLTRTVTTGNGVSLHAATGTMTVKGSATDYVTVEVNGVTGTIIGTTGTPWTYAFGTNPTTGSIGIKAGKITETDAITLTEGDFVVGDGAEFSTSSTLTLTKGDLYIGTGSEFTSTGAVTVTAGDVDVRANSTATFSSTLTITKGDMSIISGAEVTITGALTMNDGDLTVRGTLALGANATLKGNGNIYGKIVSNDIATPYTRTINVDATASGSAYAVTFKAYSGSSLVYIDVSKDTATYKDYVTIDLSGASSIVYLSGTISKSMEYGQTQTVIINGDLEIKDNAKVTIKGAFSVGEDYTLTITSGTVSIEGSGVDVALEGIVYIDEDGKLNIASTANSVEIDGLVTNNGKLVVATTNTTIAKGGSIITTDDSVATSLTNITVATGGSLQIGGKFSTADGTIGTASTITNNGTVVFNGAIFYEAVTVNMYANEAVLDVKSFEAFSAATKTLTVTDAGMTITSGYTKTYVNTVVLTTDAKAGAGISGITFTQAVSSSSTTKKVTTSTTISGYVEAFDYANAVAGTNDTTVVLSSTGTGNFKFADEFGIGEGITLTVNEAAAATVTGTMYVAGTTTEVAGLTGYLTVEGVIIGNYKSAITSTNFDAAAFTDGSGSSKIYYYASIEAAAAIISELEEDYSVTILNDGLVVNETATVPANMKLIGTGTFTIGSEDDTEVVLTIKDGSSIASNLSIVVYGSLYAENAKNIKTTKVTADVKSTNGTDLLYTNIYLAISSAESGDEIDVTTTSLKIINNITIPSGVVLYIPAGTTTTIDPTNKVTITVNGTLIAGDGLTGTWATTATDSASVLKVNGVFATGETDDLATVYTNYDSSVAGAYFYLSDDLGDYVYISSLETASLTDVKKIYICGDVTEDAEVTLGEGKELSIYGEASLTVSDLNLMKSKVKILTAGELNGFISAPFGADGTTVVKVSKLNIGYIESAYDTTDKVFSMVLDQIGGDVTVLSGVLSTDAALAMDKNSSLNVAEDAALYIPDKGNVILAGNALIYGTIVVAGDLTIASKDVVVEGTIMVSYSEEDKIDGDLEISAITLVNGDIIVAEGAVCKITETIAIGSEPSDLGSTAIISGDITLTNGKAIIAYPGADVSEMTIGKKAPLSTEFYINDELYMTAYCGSDAATVASVIAVPEYDIPELEEGAATKLKDVKTWGATSTTVIGDKDELYAEIDYATVTITTSWANGLALYINGARIMSSTTELTVGIYVITSSVNAGYACDNMTITFNGVALPVTKEGTLLTIGVEDKDSILAVSGDVYIPEPEPVTPEEKSEWTITTILLVVLVILIAIMAVIVALRLNRS